MCSRVVLPALSNPRNSNLPDFFAKPGQGLRVSGGGCLMSLFCPCQNLNLLINGKRDLIDSLTKPWRYSVISNDLKLEVS